MRTRVLTGEGESVLMLTAYTGNTAAVKVLLDRGANVNTQQFRGQSALMWAASGGHTEAVKLLLARGADVNQAGADLTVKIAGKIGDLRKQGVKIAIAN